jgi:hypothetical protein
MINCQQKVKEGELSNPATVFLKETIENPESMALPPTDMTCIACCGNFVFLCLYMTFCCCCCCCCCDDGEVQLKSDKPGTDPN